MSLRRLLVCTLFLTPATLGCGSTERVLDPDTAAPSEESKAEDEEESTVEGGRVDGSGGINKSAIASAVGRPAENLRLLDHRPLQFAFLEGRYEIYVLRDLTTDATLEIALDLSSGCRVDPVELRREDHERALVKGRRLEAQLLDLVRRHPDLSKIKVQLHFALESVARPDGTPQKDWLEPDLRQNFQACLDAELRKLDVNVTLRVRPDFPVLQADLSAPQIVKLGSSPLVQSITLVEEPVVLDDRDHRMRDEARPY